MCCPIVCRHLFVNIFNGNVDWVPVVSIWCALCSRALYTWHIVCITVYYYAHKSHPPVRVLSHYFLTAPVIYVKWYNTHSAWQRTRYSTILETTGIHHDVPYTQNNHSSGIIYMIMKLGTMYKGEKKGTVEKLYLYCEKEDGLIAEQEAENSDLVIFSVYWTVKISFISSSRWGDNHANHLHLYSSRHCIIIAFTLTTASTREAFELDIKKIMLKYLSGVNNLCWTRSFDCFPGLW